MKKIFLFMTLAFFGSPAMSKTWYLNATGPGVPVQIWAFGDDGLPLSTSPVISPPAGASYVVWPSAIKAGTSVTVYASIYDGSWAKIRRWTSNDGLNFTDQGNAFIANSAEPYGIGPAQVIYDPALSIPYIMYYLIRGPSGPGTTIAAANSYDGINWTRQGVVLTSSLPEEAGGLSMSYACKKSDGTYILLFHGYSSDFSKGVSLVATSSNPLGTFTGKSIIKSYDNFQSTVSGTSGQNTGTVPSGAIIPIGTPMLIGDPNREPLSVKRQDGMRVWFDRPLLSNHTNAAFYSMAKNKVELSYLQEQPDGSWKGIFTLYNPASLSAEYTTEGYAATLNGAWYFSGTGLRFQPFLPGISWSLENPSPAVSDASSFN